MAFKTMEGSCTRSVFTIMTEELETGEGMREMSRKSKRFF